MRKWEIMLTKEKRTALIAGLLAAVMVTATGCGNNQPKDKDEDEETRYIHRPVYIPSSSGSTSSTPSAGITSSKPPASAKVAAPASGKTGITSGGARSSVSAVS